MEIIKFIPSSSGNNSKMSVNQGLYHLCASDVSFGNLLHVSLALMTKAELVQ